MVAPTVRILGHLNKMTMLRSDLNPVINTRLTGSVAKSDFADTPGGVIACADEINLRLRC